jgi:hypothetical protein
MADVSTTCISGNPQISGRVVTRIPGSALYTKDPKINKQAPSAQQEVQWGTRFDDRGYYYTTPSP